jgi:putative mycofactocin binding protein MftB
VSTDLARPAAGAFALDGAWRVHPRVAIRPERFGALLYHFDTRRLSFLKSPAMLEVLRGLESAGSAREACERAGVGAAELPRYRAALATLAASSMICERPASGEGGVA